MDFLRDSSQVRAEYLNGLLTSAPTGQRSIMLPDNSEFTVLPTNDNISACSPRPAIPSSITSAISWPKRTHLVQCIQRVISVEISGPRFLFSTTRLDSSYLDAAAP